MFDVEIVIHDVEMQDFMREFPDELDEAINSLAFDGQAWVQDQFGSDGSPSTPGGFPGIDIGTLKNSINVQPEGKFMRSINVGAEHGVHLEFGTSEMEPRPFMMPLAHFLESNAEQMMRGYLRF